MTVLGMGTAGIPGTQTLIIHGLRASRHAHVSSRLCRDSLLRPSNTFSRLFLFRSATGKVNGGGSGGEQHDSPPAEKLQIA